MTSMPLHMAASVYAKYALEFNESVKAMCSHSNCSGNGFCQDGQCICLIQYMGGTCQDANIGYFMAFGSIFISLCLVALIQLLLCVSNEYQKEKTKSWRTAFKMTGQKLLYILTILATAVRGIYFFTRWHISDLASIHLWSAYYPILLSGSSLIVCVWAEAFHLSDIKCDKPRFLGKSTIAFTLFNVVLFGVLAIQLVAADINDPVLSEYIYKVSNGCVGLIMIIAVIFFLAYGVEVYFKVHGAFTKTQNHVDPWQLHMSRLGLIVQACLQLATALFLISDVTKDKWKNSLPILDQNFYDLGFRIAEFGVVLWFPCVLWNCKSPESLWVLNPQKLFKTLKIESHKDVEEQPSVCTNYGAITQGIKQDCWICYDPERTDAGDLIQPCQCKGDVASVHHECLRKWLMESATDEDGYRCKVCKKKYHLKQTWTFVPRYIKTRHWLQTFLSLVIMVGFPFGTYTFIHSVTTATYMDVLVIGVCILIEIACSRVLVSSLGACYRRGRLSTVTIEDHKTPTVPAIFNPTSQETNQITASVMNNKMTTNQITANVMNNKVITNQRSCPISIEAADTLTTNQRSCPISIEAVIESNILYSRLD